MKQILVLGAGQSSPYLIKYLLDHAVEYDWFVTVGDINIENARKRVQNHPRGEAIHFDVHDSIMRSQQIRKANLVVNMLSPTFQHLIALECIHAGKPMVSTSYQDLQIRKLDMDAHRKGILILNEMGLDPGIDHISAMNLMERIRQEGGHITEFISYGSGLPAPEASTNPLRYCITWNPRNVVMAGEHGAQYMEESHIKILPYHGVFQRTWSVSVDGVGVLEAYPNRDSLVYLDLYGLNDVKTMIRGTLRYPGWSETWLQIVRLGLPNETMQIPGLENRSYRELVEMFLPINASGSNLEQRLAHFLNINPTGKIMENLRWLGLFSSEKIGKPFRTSAEVLIDLLNRKLKLPEDARDMVILVNRIIAEFSDGTRKRYISTMVEYGEPGGLTAISKTVGLPAALATKLILTGQLPITGCQIPTHPAIYQPVLEELKKEGITFRERVEEVE